MNLLFSTSRQKGNNRFLQIQIILFPKFFIAGPGNVTYGVYKGMANKINRIVVFFFIKLLFKRKNYVHGINIVFYLMYSALPRGPYLRGNIIIGPKFVLFCPRGYSKIKAGIVYKDNYIWIKIADIFFAKGDIFKNLVDI